MNYRSLADLDSCIVRNLWKLPPDIDLVVGIPRSGLLVANIVALYLNVPITDLGGLAENRVLSFGTRVAVDRGSLIASARRIAIIDDSVATGTEMRRARQCVEDAGLSSKAIFVAAYVLEQASSCVDVWFEICPGPRTFAWNLLHRPMLEYACIDIDGILCADPSEEDNDDGIRYLEFLRMARPIMRPTFPIGALVTCRLEKYRHETERWLAAYGICYRELVMWNLPNRAARLANGGHAEFKAAAYRSRPWACVFVESSDQQACRIANLSLKPVICFETQKLYRPGNTDLIAGAVMNSPRWIRKGIRRLCQNARTLLLRLSQC